MCILSQCVCESCHRFCDERKMDTVARRNSLPREDFELEVLLRAHFHRDDSDESGDHSTAWVPLLWLRDLEEEPQHVKKMMQKFADVGFVACYQEFGCTMPCGPVSAV